MLRKLASWMHRRPTTRAERRRLPRQACSLPAVCGRVEALATVTDIGPGGVAIRVALPLDPGAHLEIHSGPRSLNPVRCRVVWCRPEGDSPQGEARFRAGLSFAASPRELGRSWVPSALAGLGLRRSRQEKRAAARESAGIAVGIYSPEGRLLGRATVADFSATGLRLATGFRLTEHSKVELCFRGRGRKPDRQFRGQVRYWVPGEDGTFFHGVRFLDEDSGRVPYLKSLAGVARCG